MVQSATELQPMNAKKGLILTIASIVMKTALLRTQK